MRDWFRRRRNGGNSNSEAEGNDNEVTRSETVITESELLYSIESFRAVAVPVTITMVISALAVAFINTEETIAAGEEIYAKTYQIFDVGGSDENPSKLFESLGYSLINTLVMVSVICLMTFIVVLCYKYRCMKIFYAYMVLVTAALLGYFTTNMILVAISIYPWLGRIDKLSLGFFMYNYAVVGTISIFLPRGIPHWVTQGYLIASSVCLAWQLSYFNTWMAWTLLVMLALYDLFAVLTPCGPLKALAELISKDGAPALPGLLYEARLPSGVRKPGRRGIEENQSSQEREQQEGDSHIGMADDGTHNGRDSAVQVGVSSMNQPGPAVEHSVVPETATTATPNHPQSEGPTQLHHLPTHPRRELVAESTDLSHRGQVPLALARMYQLPVLDTEGLLRQGSGSDLHRTTNNETNHEPIYYTPEEIRSFQYTSQQLKSEVTCIFPPRGGRIVKAQARDQKYDAGIAYVVYDRHGNEQRKFVVTEEGSVMEVLRRETPVDGDDEDEQGNTIKLGLGDFIFYSVLVSKAGQYSFTAFAACWIVVLTGLAATLVILAVNGKALPALPISVFLGVAAFLWTRTLLQPWLASFSSETIYV